MASVHCVATYLKSTHISRLPHIWLLKKLCNIIYCRLRVESIQCNMQWTRPTMQSVGTFQGTTCRHCKVGWMARRQERWLSERRVYLLNFCRAKEEGKKQNLSLSAPNWTCQIVKDTFILIQHLTFRFLQFIHALQVACFVHVTCYFLTPLQVDSNHTWIMSH